MEVTDYTTSPHWQRFYEALRGLFTSNVSKETTEAMQQNEQSPETEQPLQENTFPEPVPPATEPETNSLLAEIASLKATIEALQKAPAALPIEVDRQANSALNEGMNRAERVLATLKSIGTEN